MHSPPRWRWRSRRRMSLSLSSMKAGQRSARTSAVFGCSTPAARLSRSRRCRARRSRNKGSIASRLTSACRSRMPFGQGSRWSSNHPSSGTNTPRSRKARCGSPHSSPCRSNFAGGPWAGSPFPSDGRAPSTGEISGSCGDSRHRRRRRSIAHVYSPGNARHAPTRRRGAEALRIAEERLRLAVEGANVGLWNYELDSDQLFWDAHLRQQFGVNADSRVTVGDFYAMVHPDDREGVKAAFVRATEQHQMYDVEYRVGPLEAPRWIRSLARAAYRADGSPYRIDGITLDIAARKQIEDDHAALLQREQAARGETESALKTRDDFLAAASHELRNPLNALMLQLGGLRRAAQRDRFVIGDACHDRPPRSNGGTNHTAGSARRYAADVSRIKSGRLDIEYADVDLVVVARSVVQQLEPMADGVSVRLQAPETLVGRWDPLRVEQVLTNLLSNALKYGDGKPVDVDISLDGECAHIAVTDRGIGIPSDMLQRLFARFERLDSRSPSRRLRARPLDQSADHRCTRWNDRRSQRPGQGFDVLGRIAARAPRV